MNCQYSVKMAIVKFFNQIFDIKYKNLHLYLSNAQVVITRF